MTDFQLLKDTFDKMGIAYRSYNSTYDPLNYLSLEQGLGATVGYFGLSTDFVFETDGSFKEVGIWDNYA